MKKLALVLMLGILGIIGVAGFGPEASAAQPTVQVFRVYNPNTGEHLYTTNGPERDLLIRVGWRDEGVGFRAMGYSPDVSPKYTVYRAFNLNTSDHLYTTSYAEIQMLIHAGWVDDNTAFYPANDDQGQPVYRLYNPNARTGTHHYTLDTNERDYLAKVGWRKEGVAFRAWK